MSSLAPPPLPPLGRRTLSLGVEGGGQLIGFRAGGSVVASQEFFDDWACAEGWPRAGDWQQVGHTRHARFGTPNRGWIDVQLNAYAAETHGGILVLTPPHDIAER